MKRALFLLPLFLLTLFTAYSQKRPLDHSVYDQWESIGEKILSPDGHYLAYTITPQEGDGRLVIRSTKGSWLREIPRGTQVSITSDNRFVVFRILPYFKDTREAKIRKKTPEQSPKDTLAWLDLARDSLIKIPRVKSYKVPEEGSSWLAYLSERPLPDTRPADSITRIRNLQAKADSLSRVADSLRGKIAEAGVKGLSVLASPKKDKRPAADPIEEGTELTLRNLYTGEEKKFPLVNEYLFSRYGNTLVLGTTRKNGDTTALAGIYWVHIIGLQTDTVLRGFNEARSFTLDREGNQLAFVAERDSLPKALVKFYRLWYYQPGMDSAMIRADRNSTAISRNLCISPDFTNYFSKDGSRLFFGLSPIRPPKDTTLVDFETARLDIWNYKDDYLSPQQLVMLKNELKRSYLAEVDSIRTPANAHIITLGDENCETVIPSQEGNGIYALGESTKPYRIRQQWEGEGLRRLYLIDLRTGSRKMIQESVRGSAILSPGGRFILWYDWHQRNWFTYATATGTVSNITKGIHVPLYNELDDHPDDPPPHGQMGWLEDDRYVYIYDRYDIWQCDPTGRTAPSTLTYGYGRNHQLTFRYTELDKEEKFIRKDQIILLTLFDRNDMTSGMKVYRMGSPFIIENSIQQTYSYSHPAFIKARNAWQLAYLRGSFDHSYDLYVTDPIDTNHLSDATLKEFSTAAGAQGLRQMSAINPQQKNYNWFTTELHHWKMFDGKMSEGLLYKPENFDSTKKYPVIFYFYERDAETRYDYLAPQPVRASVNIPYFTSNGYLVFDPDIYYKSGQPGEDAYNSVMSAVRYLSRFKWVDTTKMALQGHSWGGYQVAYLVTRTHKFAAAEAGAPVANMTSAYDGIRWETGISREFQYEKGQSRIGATLWEHPDLYLKNSPLFRATEVTTPLLMMHNDADGAVPWYQGIEYFSALRRLDKKVWMMQYNGEEHGLTERRNRKDWSIRLAQFFGYYLKGEAPPKWMTDGVPATLKGIDWGLETSSPPAPAQ